MFVLFLNHEVRQTILETKCVAKTCVAVTVHGYICSTARLLTHMDLHK